MNILSMDTQIKQYTVYYIYSSLSLIQSSCLFKVISVSLGFSPSYVKKARKKLFLK